MEKKHEDPRHVNDGPNTNLRRKRTTRVYDGYIIEESSSREINMLRLAQSSTERSNAQESPAQKGPRHTTTLLMEIRHKRDRKAQDTLLMDAIIHIEVQDKCTR